MLLLFLLWKFGGKKTISMYEFLSLELHRKSITVVTQGEGDKDLENSVMTREKETSIFIIISLSSLVYSSCSYIT